MPPINLVVKRPVLAKNTAALFTSFSASFNHSLNGNNKRL